MAQQACVCVMFHWSHFSIDVNIAKLNFIWEQYRKPIFTSNNLLLKRFLIDRQPNHGFEFSLIGENVHQSRLWIKIKLDEIMCFITNRCVMHILDWCQRHKNSTSTQMGWVVLDFLYEMEKNFEKGNLICTTVCHDGCFSMCFFLFVCWIFVYISCSFQFKWNGFFCWRVYVYFSNFRVSWWRGHTFNLFNNVYQSISGQLNHKREWKYTRKSNEKTYTLTHTKTNIWMLHIIHCRYRGSIHTIKYSQKTIWIKIKKKLMVKVISSYEMWMRLTVAWGDYILQFNIIPSQSMIYIAFLGESSRK